MERLCDEILQLIFYDLNDPGPLTLVSKRFHRFSQEPYVRAHYFLSRFGQAEALFQALGRGKVLTERVLDILLSSGAHMSRYLVQLSVHHYFYTQSHFIKSTWVRNVPLRVFVYFLKVAEEMYGEIPRGKVAWLIKYLWQCFLIYHQAEDDGTIFSTFLKESRLPKSLKTVSWETIQDMLETYHFAPFSPKDPIMGQFPLALSIEPRLLPYAVKNGFVMYRKYRDFIFRKMFERPAVPSETDPDEISNNVKELCRLDPSMFVSRTVAAEICMEAKANETGYTALKKLNETGGLLFELGDLVEELIKSFIRTRSICTAVSTEVLRYLYTEFPTSDPIARLVILITVFITSENLHLTASTVRARLEELNLVPLNRQDICNILLSPFVDRYQVLFAYARAEVGGKQDGSKGLTEDEIRGIVEEVAEKSLEVACKGRMLKNLSEDFPSLHDFVQGLTDRKYNISIKDIPEAQDKDACQNYVVQLCREPQWDPPVPSAEVNASVNAGNADVDESTELDDEKDWPPSGSQSPTENPDPASNSAAPISNVFLGDITQETLTTMIRQDEVSPSRTRRRLHHLFFGFLADAVGRLPYPSDYTSVAKWVKAEFGPSSPVTAIFMLHAVINNNSAIISHYLGSDAPIHVLRETRQPVPITLKHFQILARLGRGPNPWMYHGIEGGAIFYTDEQEYLSQSVDQKIKVDSDQQDADIIMASPEAPEPAKNRSKKRPRRSIASKVHSYAVPDSDDEAILGGEAKKKVKPITQTNLQKWIASLSQLAKEEQRKFREEKRKAEMAALPGTKVRLNKNDFFKSLSLQLRNLKRKDLEERAELQSCAALGDITEDDDDDDYGYKPTKRRRNQL